MNYIPKGTYIKEIIKLDTTNIANITTIVLGAITIIGICYAVFRKIYKFLFPKIVFTLEACEPTAYQRPPTNKYFYFFSIKNPTNYTIKLLNIYATAGRLCKEDEADKAPWGSIASIQPIVSVSDSLPEKFDISQYTTELKPSEEVTYFARYISDLTIKRKAYIVIEYRFKHLKWLSFIYERKKIAIDLKQNKMQ